MENKSSKVIAIVGLIAGIVGISLGFAAFSNTLTIRSSADVHPDVSKFDVNFINATNAATPTAGSYTVSGVRTLQGNESANENSYFIVDAATITNNAIQSGVAGSSSIEDLRAHFTRPGQSVSYTFYARNDGEYDAWLNSVTIANVSGQSAPIICTVATTNDLTTQTQNNETTVVPANPATTIPEGERATDATVQAACQRMKISISITNRDTTPVTTTREAYFADSTHALVNTSAGETNSVANSKVDGHKLNRGDYETVVVTLTYQPEETGMNQRPDGVMDVAFGDITLVYGSVD